MKIADLMTPSVDLLDLSISILDRAEPNGEWSGSFCETRHYGAVSELSRHRRCATPDLAGKRRGALPAFLREA